MEAAYFFNDLTENEFGKLESWINAMRIGVTQNEKFIAKLKGIAW
jgi:hypothetical protein